MKKTMLITMVVLFTAGVVYFAFAAQTAEQLKIEGKEVCITGKLSCTFCKFAHPDKTCTPDCCTNCIKAGDPPLLCDGQGNMFLLLTGEHEVPLLAEDRMKMLGGQVTVKGMLVKQSGIQAIYVNSMEKAEPKQVTLTGKLSCTFCKLTHPDKSCTAECCIKCVKAGDPPLLTDAQGEMFILLTGEKETPLMTEERMAMMSTEVTVKGLMVNRNGMKAVFVDSMAKADK